MIGILLIALLQTAAGGPGVGTAQPAPTPPAVEQPAVAPPPSGAQKTQAARHELHCQIVTVTGSRMGQRVCRSRADEERMTDVSRQALEHMQGMRMPPTN